MTVGEHGVRGRSGDVEKPPGTCRILAFGGSHTYGADVSDGESWPGQLEAELRRRGHAVEVWNLGVSGWETQQKVAALRAAKLEADAAIVQIHNLGPPYVLAGHAGEAIAGDAGLRAAWAPGAVGPLALARLPAVAKEKRRRASIEGWPADRLVAWGTEGLQALTRLQHDGVLPFGVYVPLPGLQDKLEVGVETLERAGIPLLDLRDAEHPFGEQGEHIHPGAGVYAWTAARLADWVEGGALPCPAPRR